MAHPSVGVDTLENVPEPFPVAQHGVGNMPRQSMCLKTPYQGLGTSLTPTDVIVMMRI